MKDIKNFITEASFPMEFDKSIKAAEKRKVQNAIYKQLEKTGTTGRFYRDDSWEGVRLVRKDIQDAFKLIKNPEHEYEVSIAPDEGGYRKSKDGLLMTHNEQLVAYKESIYCLKS
jgi:hypothetical protein